MSKKVEDAKQSAKSADKSDPVVVPFKLPRKSSQRIARIGRWEERSAEKYLTAPGG